MFITCISTLNNSFVGLVGFDFQKIYQAFLHGVGFSKRKNYREHICNDFTVNKK